MVNMAKNTPVDDDDEDATYDDDDGGPIFDWELA